MHRKNFWFMRQPEFWLGRAVAKWLKYDRAVNNQQFQQTVSSRPMRIVKRRQQSKER